MSECSPPDPTLTRRGEALDLAAQFRSFSDSELSTWVRTHEMNSFMNGKCVRRLGCNRDEGCWRDVDGEPKSWERTYFFDEDSTANGDTSPDMLSEEQSGDDTKRYWEAKRAFDARSALSLLHPSSTAPMLRVSKSFGIESELPTGRWKKRSARSRPFG